MFRGYLQTPYQEKKVGRVLFSRKYRQFCHLSRWRLASLVTINFGGVRYLVDWVLGLHRAYFIRVVLFGVCKIYWRIQGAIEKIKINQTIT